MEVEVDVFSVAAALIMIGLLAGGLTWHVARSKKQAIGVFCGLFAALCVVTAAFGFFIGAGWTSPQGAILPEHVEKPVMQRVPVPKPNLTKEARDVQKEGSESLQEFRDNMLKEKK